MQLIATFFGCLSVCLTEAMRQRNQTMKDRFEELSVWSKKVKEEREFYTSKFKEARQFLASKCVENEALKKQLQTVREKDNGLTNLNKTDLGGWRVQALWKN